MPSNPWSLIKGKPLNHRDLVNWTPDRWMDLLRFFEFFIVKNENNEEAYMVTVEKIKEVEEMTKDRTHVFTEFFLRLGFKGDESQRQLASKVNSVSLNCLTYLKKHPATVTEEMRNFILSHKKKMGWALSQYKVTDSAMGEIVTQDIDTPKQQQPTIPSIQTKIMNSLIHIADLYEEVSGSLTSGQIKKLPPMDKIKVLKDLAFIFQAVNKRQTNNHFTQINLNGNARDLEQEMLKFAKGGKS